MPAPGSLRTAAHLPAEGSVLDGKYRIGQRVGEGAMGVVLWAADIKLARPVAIKVIHPWLSGTEGLRQRLVAEAQAMARVRHPNVVEIYGGGEYSGTPYFAMEYVAGPNLRTWLDERDEQLSVDEALGVLEQICAGVEAMHAAGSVHWDLKPANVLIGQGFRVAVADLGVLRPAFSSDPEDTSSVGGSPAYMAPEVVLSQVSQALARRVDVYSLGVMAFELLTGRLPFPGGTGIELMRDHVEVEPPKASDLRPDLPRGFDDVLVHALTKDPTRRMAEVGELCLMLRRSRDRASRIPT